MSHRLDELLDYLVRSVGTFDAAIATVPAERHDERPAADRWSVREVVEHVALVEAGISKSYRRWLDDARANGLPTDDETSPLLAQMRMDRVVDRSRRIEAPPFAVPTQHLSLTDSLAKISAARGELDRLARSADGLALGVITHNHPALGPLTLYEWLAFTAAHMERHAAQIREIGAQLG
jgi:uncharacterized damage-inducible protein DinB